jgi:hypothetical protein
MPRDYSDTIDFLTPDDLNKPLPISIGLSGGSGTGKTYTALLLASGMADAKAGMKGAPIAFIDTENRRGLHYRDAFPQMLGHYVDFGPTDKNGELIGYPPERWIALIDAAEKRGVHAMVIDSFSHAWEGINGVLDLQAAELERLSGGDEKKAERVGQLAWAAIKPRYRRLINRIIRSDVNTIICTRAKPVMQNPDFKGGGNARATKLRRRDVPWDVAADADLVFEMTAMVVLDPAAPGCPRYQIKVADQFKRLFKSDLPLTAAIGGEMAEWARGRGSAQQEKALMDEARAEARKGKDALQAWYKPRPQADKALLATIMDELKTTAIAADEAAEESGDDLFPTAEQRAAAEAEALAAIAAQEG